MIALAEQPFKCQHCDKSFMKEKTLVAHMCERKRRALQRDEKRVQTGFYTYNKFYQITQNQTKNKTYNDFIKSSYYNAFVKFGSYVNNINPIYPEKFIEHVIKSGVKLDHWCRDALYEAYLYDMLKVEPIENAVQRTLATMIEWSELNQANYIHYFLYVSPNRAVHDIRDGKITPWLLLNCKSGKALLNNFSDEQLTLLEPVLDLAFWKKKFKSSPADLALIKEICKETGIE